MNRRQVLLAGGTLAAGGLAGCLGSAQSQSDDPTEDNADTESERTIRVSKSGEATTEPDLAILQVAVEASASDAQSVRDDLAAQSETLQEALIEFGIDEDDITTARYDINEQRNDQVERQATETDTADGGDGEDETVTYEGVHAFTVEVPDVDEIGAVIDTAVDAGADNIDRAQFTLSDETREELREDALEDAMGNARGEAEVLAGEADSSILDVRSVESSDSAVQPVNRDVVVAQSGGDGGGGGTELASDDVTVTAQVQVTYDIE